MVQPYPGNSPVFRGDGRLHAQGQPQQASYVSHTELGQSLNDSLHKDTQPVRLQQAPQPVVIKQGGREHVVLLSPSSYGGRSSQQHRIQVKQHLWYVDIIPTTSTFSVVTCMCSLYSEQRSIGLRPQ